MNYPRVLIIGQSFSGISGASITLRNLFEDWPKDKIAVASNSIDEYDENTFKYSYNNYRLGDSEISVISPFNSFFSLKKSRILKKEKVINSRKISITNQSRLKSIIKKFFIKTGINSVRFNYSTSNEFINWYKSFAPQIVYSAVGDLDLIRFLLKIKDIDNVPIALHIWDDWPNTLADRTFFKRYWQKKIDAEFRDLLLVSNKLLSISDMMSKEYKRLYNREFIPFHNPINIEEWDTNNPVLKIDKSNIILYVGKINKDTIELLLLMSQTVQVLNKENKNGKYSFHIYSPDRGYNLDRFYQYKETVVFNAIPHEQVISVMKKASILFLPLGFSEKSIRYTRLSMPTKVSEFMISGTPIIVMAPPEIALTKYAKDYKWAMVVDEKNLQLLKEAILKLTIQDVFVEELIFKAVTLAKDKHDASKVREYFKMQLIDVARNE